jgi:hypothetical protein
LVGVYSLNLRKLYINKTVEGMTNNKNINKAIGLK